MAVLEPPPQPTAPTASVAAAAKASTIVQRSRRSLIRETLYFIVRHPAAAVRRRAARVDRPAHPGHARSLDSRLTEAPERLELWGDPLAPIEPQRGVEAPRRGADRSGGLLLGCARWALRLAGGGCAEAVLRPLWSAYWRHREYAADAYAASLGQAEDLARYLAEQELPFDPPQRRLLLNPAEHPPVAFRIARLQSPSPP